MIQICCFQKSDEREVIDLVLRSQNDGTRPPVGVDDQPDLLAIPETYFHGGGFWVAKEGGHVVGTIGLLRCQDDCALMKKFFVKRSYQGAPHHLGQRLYRHLLSFARAQGIKTLFLDTPKNTLRAHRFYEKAGFKQINECDLPFVFSHPYQNCDFFKLAL